jgi:hypothetical protein
LRTSIERTSTRLRKQPRMSSSCSTSGSPKRSWRHAWVGVDP